MATSPEVSDSVKLLLQNDKNTFIEAANLLVKIAKNVLDNPGEEKYRKLRISGRTLSNKLLPVEGGFQCLFDMGFQEADEFILLPHQASMEPLRNMADHLQQQINIVQAPNSVTTSGSASGSVACVPAPNTASNAIPNEPMSDVRTSGPAGVVAGTSSQVPGTSGGVSGQPLAALMQSEAKFYQKILSSTEHVLLYESKSAQKKALTCIPFTQLNNRVQKTMESLGSTTEVDPKDLLLLELLAWFKKEFFTWMNSPPCGICRGSTQSVGPAEPRPDELRSGAHRVENYRCGVCGSYTRFPRYNDPIKLLETRTGRCGEWANCFTLCCRAVGLEARYVLDWTDHVWTEVYSQKQDRWLHCDPCEDVCDKPLIYEAGWNKKLSYILAFSVDDIQDVTWRYSNKHKEVLSRRTECRESWLLDVILRQRKQRQPSLPADRQSELKRRLVVELVEFLQMKSVDDGEKVGRVSGSTAWRTARGEIGGATVKGGHVIKPTANEICDRLVHISYSCTSNSYTRLGSDNVQDWHSLAHETENVLRKEEKDWRMVYLARTEGSESASISWKLDLQGSGMVVDTAEVEALSTTYENGRISWRVCGDEQCAILPADGKRTKIDNLGGSETFTLTASLSGGQGNVAWQHTQLFRQSLDDTASPLDIKITLKPQS